MSTSKMRERRSTRGSESEEALVSVQNGIEDEELPDFSDPDNYVDSITDEELLFDILRQRPSVSDVNDCVIVVDNAPQVNPDRFDKLKSVLHKHFGKFGSITHEHYPVDEKGTTKGFIFLCYSKPQSAKEALNLNGHKLDKSHTLAVNLFSDFEKFANLSQDWEVPEPLPYHEQPDLQNWLLDDNCFDEYVITYDRGCRTAIYRNTVNQAELVHEKQRWSDAPVVWSPRGTYLATFHHNKGIILWGGKDFRRLYRFGHANVQMLDFSPCETYLVTFSPELHAVLPSDEPTALIIWHIKSGVKKRSFHCDSLTTAWPVFKWSFDGKFFARISPDAISVYETPSFGLHGRKSIKVSDVKEMGWSPGDNILACWAPENQDTPAKVTLFGFPSREELRSKNLFNVINCTMSWHPQGLYFCVKVDRYTSSKTKKTTSYNLELFRMAGKGIPVDTVELKEDVISVGWEPQGHKLAIIHGESPRTSVSLYEMKSDKVVLLKTLEKRSMNYLSWCPQGKFLVVADIRSSAVGGTLEFIDTSDMTTANTVEHFMATDVDWDPTGRYVVSSVSYLHHKVDNAYWLWSFQGKLIQRNPVNEFLQLLWRPRPATVLDEADVKQVRKNIKKYQKDFEIKDRLSHTKASKELLMKREALTDRYKQWRQQMKDNWRQQQPERKELRDGVDCDDDLDLDDDEDNYEEEILEFLVREDVTVLSSRDE